MLINGKIHSVTKNDIEQFCIIFDEDLQVHVSLLNYLIQKVVLVDIWLESAHYTAVFENAWQSFVKKRNVFVIEKETPFDKQISPLKSMSPDHRELKWLLSDQKGMVQLQTDKKTPPKEFSKQDKTVHRRKIFLKGFFLICV